MTPTIHRPQESLRQVTLIPMSESGWYKVPGTLTTYAGPRCQKSKWARKPACLVCTLTTYAGPRRKPSWFLIKFTDKWVNLYARPSHLPYYIVCHEKVLPLNPNLEPKGRWLIKKTCLTLTPIWSPMHQASFCQNQRPVQINLHRKPKHRSRTSKIMEII